MADWVSAELQLAVRPPAQAIGLATEGYMTSGVLFEDFNGASVVAHMVNRGKLSRRFLWMVGDYAFNQMKVQKVIAPVWDTNQRMREVAEKLGFALEARLHGAAPDGDILLYTLRQNDYRFQGEHHGKIRQSPAVA